MRAGTGHRRERRARLPGRRDAVHAYMSAVGKPSHQSLFVLRAQKAVSFSIYSRAGRASTPTLLLLGVI